MSCRGCGSDVTAVISLGNHRIPDFTAPGAPSAPAYPLNLVMCSSCGLLQLEDSTPRNVLYHERYGFKSGVNEAIRADLASIVRTALDVVPEPHRWLDIASNDGTLLSNVPVTVHRTGVDPLVHLAPEASKHADRIISDYFDSRYFDPGEFDVITSVSMFYDLDNPGEFCRRIAGVLSANGVWVCQQNYALDMLRSNAVDNICHEHVTYFSLSTMLPLLEQANLQCNDISYSSVNGGCFRVTASHRGVRGVNASVTSALDVEERAGLGEISTWQTWSEEVLSELARTREFLDDMHAHGKRTYVYGASTRGGTILQAIGAGPELLPYAVERQPAKFGKIMAATGIPVISEAEMRADPPDALLVSPWFFRDVFVSREMQFLDNGGMMVFPLPRFEVLKRK